MFVPAILNICLGLFFIGLGFKSKAKTPPLQNPWFVVGGIMVVVWLIISWFLVTAK
jgi:hypothetical protein